MKGQRDEERVIRRAIYLIIRQENHWESHKRAEK